MYCREASMRSSVQKRWSLMATAVFCSRQLRELCRVQGDCGRDDNRETMYDVGSATSLLSSLELVESVSLSPKSALNGSIPSSHGSFYSALDEVTPSSYASFSVDSKKDEAHEIREHTETLLSPASTESVGYGSSGPNGPPDEPNPSPDASFFRKSLDWFFPIANVLLEVLAEVFNQISSKRQPDLGLVGTVMSFATLLVCIIELIYRGCMEDVAWQKWGMIYWFLHPNHSAFGTLSDVIVVICSILQCVFASIAYAFYCRHVDDPIKLSVWPIIFAFGLLFSKIYQYKSNSRTVTEPRRGPGPGPGPGNP